MSVLHAGADLAAIEELENILRAADPANTGLLSYSEFAYQILRSGGTQEQVDALIEQFAGPSRAQRVVYYEALLEQLYDSVEATRDARSIVEDGSPRHTSNSLQRMSSLGRAPSAPPTDTSGHSPLPIPPAPTCATPSPWHAPNRSTAAAASAPREATRARRYGESPAASSYSPLCRSVTHAGASTSSAALLASRELSTASYASCSTRHDRPLAHLLSSSSAASLHSSLRGKSSPYSSRFVESALRAATAAAAVPPQQHRLDRAPSHRSTHISLSASRSKSRDEARANPLTPSPIVGAQDAERTRLNGSMTPPRYAADTNRYPSTPRAHSLRPLRSGHSRRESSIERMMRAAAEVNIQRRPQLRSEWEGGADAEVARKGEGNGGPRATLVLPEAPLCTSRPTTASSVHPATTNRAPRGAASQAKRTNVSFNESRATGVCARHADGNGHDSQHSSATAAPLLSLRDIFHRHLAPSSSRDSTVLLSELEEALATRGVDVHPLELEAVADSLDMSAAPAAVEHHNSALQHHSLNTSQSGGLGERAATVACTGCGESQLCSSVDASGRKSADVSATTASRATTVTGGADRALSLVDFCVLVSRLRPALIQRIRSPDVWEGTMCFRPSETPRGCQPPPVRSRLGARSVAGADDGDSGDGASIADVTVSPMTPTAVAPATPPCSASSPSLPPHSSPEHRRPRRGFAGPRRSPRAAAPPTARQLSNDRQFSVEHALREPRRSPEAGERDGSLDASASYAQPTAASQQRCCARRASSMTTAPLRRTKVPVWSDGLRASAPRSHTSTARSPPPTSPGTSRGSVSPDARHHLQQQPHHADVVLRSPTSNLFPHVAREELGAGLHLRDHEAPLACSPVTTVEPLSPQLTHRRGLPSPNLAPRVLETLQSAALALLRRCAQLDSRHTGRIAPSAWLRVLQDACPTLTNAERLRVREWIQARGQGSAGGDDYAAVVEDILTEADVASPSPTSAVKSSIDRQSRRTAASSPPHDYAIQVHGTPRRSDAVATRPSVSSTSTAKDASPVSSLSAAKPNAAVRRRSSVRVPASAQRVATVRVQTAEKNTKRLLANELMIACGGDTEALLQYFRAFDEANSGLLDQHVWRASLEELFRQTEGQEAPPWVVSGCVRLSRVPLEVATATPSPQRDTSPLASPALSAARARVSRVPPAMRHTLCDYRYVLEELGVHVGD
ncbi:hypothetical protein LSCM4_04445 [Leishmania orientalis]|uniref:EF-hand domain-containing protein n=1 Tax=Leishmania orientalis TaxID=2249476 RepID=A0A836H0J1_9TRYP|nr:hypothetical protein LSCM4_04445 [Leishmania orientalis]